MINELYSVYQGLKDIGEEPVIKHNDIKSPGENNITFRVCLSEDGNVESLEMLSKAQIKNTWSIANGNQNHFPAAKFEYPFIPEGHREYLQWKEECKNPDAHAYRKMLSSALGRYSISLPKIDSWPNYRGKILEYKEVLTQHLKCNEEGLHLLELYKRYANAEESGVAILRQIAEKFKQEVVHADIDTLKGIANACFCDAFDKIKKGELKSKVTWLIDCLPQKDIDIHASSRSRVPVLSKALFVITSKNSKSGIGICAITGDENTELVESIFPSEKLSIIGDTKLLAKSKTTSGLTVQRYGKSGADSFSMSKAVAENLAASISFLTSDHLENKTWRKIPSSTGGAPSLLIAYCKSDFDLSVTPVITGDSIDDFDDYEDATETVLKLFYKSDCIPDDAVEICELKVLDKANRKVNYSTSSSVAKIQIAAKEWVNACKNIPDFKLLVNIEKKHKLIMPWAIAPINAIDISRTRVKRVGDSIEFLMLNKNGRKVKPTPTISFTDIMTLFLSQSNDVKLLALRILIKLANQVEPLFEYCALSKNQWRLDKKNQRVKTDTNKNSTVLKTVTLFGILLFYAGCKKEDYMSSFAYQLGQLCSAMDELHIGYCQDMRKGDIPNTLIGNSTYKMALQNSKKALGMLSSRIVPYHSWGKRKMASIEDINKELSEATKSGLYAHLWLKKQATFINESLQKDSEVITDTFKAELMLGYLAGRSFKEEN